MGLHKWFPKVVPGGSRRFRFLRGLHKWFPGQFWEPPREPVVQASKSFKIMFPNQGGSRAENGNHRGNHLCASNAEVVPVPCI
jgi:hypothetical protein